MLDGCLPRWSKAQPSSSSPPPSPSPDRTVLSWHRSAHLECLPCPATLVPPTCLYVQCCTPRASACSCACACACGCACVLVRVRVLRIVYYCALCWQKVAYLQLCPVLSPRVCVCVCVFVCVCVVCMSSVALNVRVCGEDCARVCANCGRVVC